MQEGTIVRAISRLDETCREVRDAARVIGDASLYQKMEAARELIRRDVICASGCAGRADHRAVASSLYV